MAHLFGVEQTCWHCLGGLVPGLKTATLRLDKRGRLFVACVCGSYTFYRSTAAHAGLAVVGPVVEAISLRMEQDPAYAAELRENVRKFRVELAQSLQFTTPAEIATPASSVVSADSPLIKRTA